MPFPAGYVTEAAKAVVSINYYLVITGIATKFSKKAVVGQATESNLSKLTFNPSRLALDNVKTTIGSFSVRMIDPSDTFLTALQAAAVQQNVADLYVGFTNLDVATYHKLASFRVEQIQAVAGTKEYVINATDSLRDLVRPIILAQSPLTADINDSTLTIPLETTGFSSTGTLQLGDEQITWTSKTATQLNASARGANGSTAASHKTGENGIQIVTVTQNPITALLQLLISPGGGGAYDVLSYGLGISNTKINTASFESVRDNTTLSGQTWRFDLVEDIDSFLKFAEDEILFFTNTRLYTDLDGKLALVAIEQVSIDSLTGTLPRASVLAPPDTVQDSKRIFNQITVRWDWDAGTQKFKSEATYNEETGDSQSFYGVIKKATIESKGIRQGLDGAAITQDFADRLLRRMAFPGHQFSTIKTLWEKQFFDLGQKVQFIHDQAISLTRGERGVNQIIEILEKKWDFDAGTVSYTANASELLSERWGFISPASDVVSAASASVFTLTSGHGVKWAVGNKVALWLQYGGSAPIDTSTITDVTGDQITVSPAFSSTPTTAHMILYADYDAASDDQKIYGWITDDSNLFPDGGEPYLISD